MKRIPKQEAQKKLFLDRTRYRPILIDDIDSHEGSRIAGTPPKCLSSPQKCLRCQKRLDYLLTIESDLVGSAIAQGQALSIFTCTNIDCRLESMTISTNPPSVVAITHLPSPRSREKSRREGRRLTRGHLRVERQSSVGDSSVEDSKLGGRVFQIQSAIGQDEADAVQRGLVFLLQLNDASLGQYTTSLGFWGGEAYLFTKANPATGLPTLEHGRIAWSYT